LIFGRVLNFYREERKLLLSDPNVRGDYYAKRPLITWSLQLQTPLKSCHLAKARIKLILALHLTPSCKPNSSTNSSVNKKNFNYKYIVFV